MTLTVTAVVLFAAVLHSGWNAIAKAIPDRLAASTLIALVYLASGIAGAVVFGVPPEASWPFMAASACLQTTYLILLTTSYKHGDFSQVYPLARGLAVLLVAAVAMTVLAEQLSPVQLAGVAVVAGSLLSLTLTGGRAAKRKGTLFALLTGVCIAAYTLVDGVGVRVSGEPLGYVAWLFLLQGAMIPLLCWWLAPSRATFVRDVRSHWKPGLLGGLMSMLAYASVVWAQSLAPLALVSALRETSVLLAGVIGAVFFSERFSKVRMGLTAAAVCGIVAMQMG